MGAVVTFKDITERKQLEEVLQESEERYRMLFEGSTHGILMTDIGTGRFVDANLSMCRMLGYSKAELLQLGIADIHPKDLRDHVMSEIESQGRGDQPVSREIPCLRKDGTVFYADIVGASTIFRGRRCAVGYFMDITARRQSEEMLRESEEKFRAIFDGTRDGVLIADATTKKFLQGNAAICSMLGYTKEEIGSLTVTDIHPPINLSHIIDEFEKMMKGLKDFSEDLPVLRKDGTVFYADISNTSMTIRGIHYLVGLFHDITERRQTDEKIQQMAYHDSLTGLPNRKLFSDRLGIALAQAQRNQQKVGIAMLDLDNFKDVNDTMGHDVGDLLLQAAAERLRAVLRKSDTIARFGGDEFVLILPDLEVIKDTIQVAQKIVDSFCKPFIIDAHRLIVTMSIGIAVYPNDGIDEGMLLKNADIAMYQVKQAGRARYQLYKEA